MSKIGYLAMASLFAAASNDGKHYPGGAHIPQKDAPPPQAVQDELIAKAKAKRLRKNQKRLYDNFGR